MDLKVDNSVTLDLMMIDDVKFGLSSDVQLIDPKHAYNGPYEIRPQVIAQVLPTSGKSMRKDLKINRIPRYEVSNDSGGSTFTIGADIGD